MRETVRSPPAAARRAAPIARSGPGRLELAGYLAVAAGLLAMLLLQLRHADAFYLDEWMYTHGAEYMWDEFPGAVSGEIPNWTRGLQRLYSLLLAPLWGLFTTPTAYTLSHVLNALMLVSTVVPAALLARRIVERPALRVLAVALAVGVPWLIISINLLTENLAFPLLMWSVYAISRAAEAPTLLNQLAALVLVLAISLTRLNLAVMGGVLVLAILVAELQRLRGPGGAGGFLRRRAPLLGALVVAVLGGVWAWRTGRADLGAYGAFTDENYFQAKWDQRDLILTTFATYSRAFVTGSFVFPFVIGVAAALAALRGALGPAARLPALVALACWIVVVGVVSVWTVGAALEERYVFAAYAPLALFAAAGVEHLRRIRVELVGASLIAILLLARGVSYPGTESGHYFAAPARAFWSRVVEYRLVLLDRNLLGFLPGETNWRPVAAVLVAFVVVVGIGVLVARLRRRLELVVGGGLVLCVVAQLLVLDFAFARLLNGTPEVPGGFARAPGHAADRDDWIDRALPKGASAALVPPPLNSVGAAERIQFWNRSIDGVTAMRFAGAGVTVSAGHEIIESPLQDGLAGWQGPSYEWIAGQRDDPRVQFAGTPVGRARNEPYELIRRERGSDPAIWTATGLEPDLFLLARKPVTMTLARKDARDVRSVVVSLRAPDPIVGTVSWRIRRAGRTLADGRLSALGVRNVRLRVPPCPPQGVCAPVAWKLSAQGAAADVPIVVYGPSTPRDPVSLQLVAARLERP